MEVNQRQFFQHYKELNKANINKQGIKAGSPDKIFLEIFPYIELQISIKNPIPKLLAATTFAVALPGINVSLEELPAIVSTEKISGKIINNPNRI